MSATVVYYPESYIRLLTLLKDRVLSGRAAAFPRSNVQVGVSTNFNKICGCVLQVALPAAYPSTCLPVTDMMASSRLGLSCSAPAWY